MCFVCFVLKDASLTYWALFLAFSYQRSHLGGYLVAFMWKRKCKIEGVDPFSQILRDMGEYYNSQDWIAFAQKCGIIASTEKKARKLLMKGADLVRISMVYLSKIRDIAWVCKFV